MRLYGKALLKDQLDFIAGRGHMPHAILLYGERGSGRRVMAAYIAKLFMCSAPPCDGCTVCSRVDACSHPDVIYVKRECGGKYNLSETDKNLVSVRQVMDGVVIKPNDGDVKVYVFEDEQMIYPQVEYNTMFTSDPNMDAKVFKSSFDRPNLYYEEMLDKLSETSSQRSPLLETLITLVNCNGNVDIAAQKMFQHKNTIRYRMNKLKAVFAADNELEFYGKLYLFSRIHFSKEFLEPFFSNK